MKNQSVHYLNGKFVKEEDLVIPVRDLGFTRGYGVFDFFVTYSQKPFKLSEHIERLLNSAELIGLEVPWNNDQIKEVVMQTLKKNLWKEEKAVKLILSGGLSETMVPSSKEPTFVIVVDECHIFPEELYKTGMGIISVRHERYNPQAKSNNYIEGVKQSQKAKRIGAVEPLYFDENQVFEGSNSNVFAVINNELITPKSNILSGVTRDLLIEILRLDIPVLEKDFRISDLLKAKEVFFTSSMRGIAPATKVDGKKVGDGKVGPVTREVTRQLKEYIKSGKW
jgi:branched-chain amino acid aminotransferase